MKGRIIKSIEIAVSVLCFFSVVSFQLFSIDNDIIQHDFLRAFFGRPGCGETLLSKNRGHWFEMETALCLRHGVRLGEWILRQPVEGFSLSLSFWPKLCLRRAGEGGRMKEVCLGGVEFDVITTEAVVESKSGLCPEEYRKKSHEQFLRQKLILKWCAQVNEDLETESIEFFDQVLSSHGKSCLLLKGPCTNMKEVRVWSSWIKEKGRDAFLLRWKYLFSSLSKKHQLIFYKHKVSDELMSEFQGAGYRVYDLIDFDGCCART